MIGNRSLELFVDIAVTTVAAAMVGLALSALAKSNEQIMPLLVVAIMSQLVFSGGMIPVTDRIVLDQMSWFTPARWGFASIGVDDRSHQARSRSADTERLALEAHRRARGCSTWRCSQRSASATCVRALEDPPQGRLSFSG